MSPGGSGYFTCKQNLKLVTNKFKSGGLHEKDVVATWNVGNHLSICLQGQGNQEKPVSRWPVAGPYEYWLLASSRASKVAASFPRSKVVGVSSNTIYLPQMLRLRVNGSLAPPPPPYISMTWCVINHRDDIAQEDVSRQQPQVRHPLADTLWCLVLTQTTHKNFNSCITEKPFRSFQRATVSCFSEEKRFVCEMHHCWHKW